MFIFNYSNIFKCLFIGKSALKKCYTANVFKKLHATDHVPFSSAELV